MAEPFMAEPFKAESLQVQMENLRLSINGLEAQRSILGDKVVNPALAALRRQLAELEEQAAVQAVPVYRSCAETFEALGDVENFRVVIECAHQVLMEAIETINVPEWRQSFLENVPDHRAIMEMWERRKL